MKKCKRKTNCWCFFRGWPNQIRKKCKGLLERGKEKSVFTIYNVRKKQNEIFEKIRKTSLTYSRKNGNINKLSRTVAVKLHKMVAIRALKKLIKKFKKGVDR